MLYTWRDRRHWEVSLGRRSSLSRWCAGAPCQYVTSSGHPVRFVRVRRFGGL